ncbi:hypothetical protein Ahy_A08g039267 [Arachis hypogaea]|uniref:PB1-like domain-containing protein n=1 Tax=Arachis hypogaea TaxID=3818 RepID=A0A445BW86_ARAHY|nr:hypothetical protein Ahy_A08g039267 [Arachis hypogaea]
MGLITIVCHHGGSFVRSEDGVVSYTRDHILEILKLDPDRLDVFFIRNYNKELGCASLLKATMERCMCTMNMGVSIPTYLEEPPFRKDKEEVVIGVPTQPVFLRTGPSSRAIPPDPVPTPCINRPSTTEPTQEATFTKTTPAPPNQDMDHIEVPAATTKSTLTPKSTILTPISMAATPAPPNQDMGHTQEPAATMKSTPISKSTPTLVPKPKQGKIFQLKMPSKNGTEKKGAALKKKTENKGERRTTLNRRYVTKRLAKGHVARQTTKDSSDSYESAEDSAYKPGAEESLSDEEVTNTILPDIGGYDAHDEYHDESDGADSCHSKEMKTLPNSEDEFAEVQNDDAFPVFREETRFGEVRLEVGMKFNTKMDFKEAVREYCIQEDRRVRFKKNDKIQCRTLWRQKDRLANRGWLASKLVKKLRKFSNLKHSEFLTYFKSKCDLELNKSSLTRALGDARHIVYGDAAAQYGMGHNKSNCAKKKADDEAAAVAAVAAAAPSEANTGNQQQPLPAAPEVPDEGNATEIEVGMSQPMVSKNENEESHQVNQPQARPPKLPQKRRQPPPPAIASIPPAATSAPPLTVSNASPPATVPISNTPPPTSVCIDPMVGASVATASRLRNAMRFVPTPGFKPPRKFNK